MDSSSSSDGFCPRDLIAIDSSLLVIVPDPSRSNKLNASLYSENTGMNPLLTNGLSHPYHLDVFILNSRGIRGKLFVFFISFFLCMFCKQTE